MLLHSLLRFYHLLQTKIEFLYREDQEEKTLVKLQRKTYNLEFWLLFHLLKQNNTLFRNYIDIFICKAHN